MVNEWYPFGCGELSSFFVIPITAISSILVLANTWLFGLTVYHFFYQRQDAKVTEIKLYLKLLCAAALFGFTLHCINGLIEMIIYSQCPSKRLESQLYRICIKFTQHTYHLPLSLQYILFMLRVKNAFDSSIIALDGRTLKTLYSLAFWLVSIIPMFEIMTIIVYNGYQFVATPIFIAGVCIWSLIYVISFFYASRVLSKQIRLCCDHLFQENTVKQRLLYRFTVKIFVCVFAAMPACILGTILYPLLNTGTYNLGLLFFAIVIYFSVNTFFLVLQWPMFDNWYQTYLHICDQCVRKCYKDSIEAKNASMSVTLGAIESN